MLPSVQVALKVLQAIATIQGAAADLAHSGGRDGAEGPDEVGLDPGGGSKVNTREALSRFTGT